MAYLDWRAPLPDLSDVPVERDRVTAMGQTSDSYHGLFRPYVYRGTGEDQHPLWTLDPPAPRKKPERDPKKIRAANMKRAQKYGYGPYKDKPRFDIRPRLNYAPRLPDPPWAPGTHSWKLEKRLRLRARQEKMRPSPGWKPMTGADIEDILAELGADD